MLAAGQDCWTISRASVSAPFPWHGSRSQPPNLKYGERDNLRHVRLHQLPRSPSHKYDRPQRRSSAFRQNDGSASDRLAAQRGQVDTAFTGGGAACVPVEFRVAFRSGFIRRLVVRIGRHSHLQLFYPEFDGQRATSENRAHRAGRHVVGGILGRGQCRRICNLLDSGASAASLYNEGDPYFDVAKGSTTLHVAAWHAWPDTVRELIARNPPVNAVDGKGRTALALAVRACVDSYWTMRRSPDSVRALLDAGASASGIEFPSATTNWTPCSFNISAEHGGSELSQAAIRALWMASPGEAETSCTITNDPAPDEAGTALRAF